MDQADLIQNMVTGKTAHVMMVNAAWSQMDDPTKSAVVDKVEFAATPHAQVWCRRPALAIGWAASHAHPRRPQARHRRVPALVPEAAQMATARAGGIPVSAAIFRDPIAQERKYRWMKSISDPPHAISALNFPEASEVIPILELGLNQAVAGEITAVTALNSMADQIHGVMAKYKYNTGALPKLN